MRYIIWYLIISFSLSHAIVNIDSSSSKITDFEIDYLIDDTKKLKFEDIKSKKFLKGKNANSLGAKVTNSWVKIKLLNITDKSKKLFLHQELAYAHASIKYYEVDEKDKLLNTKEMNKHFSKEKMNIYGSDSIYEFTLEPNQTKTIYINETV